MENIKQKLKNFYQENQIMVDILMVAVGSGLIGYGFGTSAAHKNKLDKNTFNKIWNSAYDQGVIDTCLEIVNKTEKTQKTK